MSIIRWVLLTTLLIPAAVLAQTGLPPFGSFTQGDFDTINNQNLNVYFSIPIVSSAGRGLPLNLSLVNNSLLWQVTGGVWTPVVDSSGNFTWGWQKDFPVGRASYYTYTSAPVKCEPGGNFYPITYYQNYAYVDALGTGHGFPTISFRVSSCPAQNGGTKTGSASDATGYYMDASSGVNPKVTGPGGVQLVGGNFTSVDVNGNYVTKTVVSPTETDWTDSVGNVALKILYNTTATPPNITYQFLDGTGLYQSIVLKLQAFNIKTQFLCPSVTDFTGTSSVQLPVELDVPSPNGGNLVYTFAYEATPGFSTYTTGRVQKVTLPMGGSYQYNYPTGTGQYDGINCTDGSTVNLGRVVSDGTNTQTWNFSRNTTALTTTVTTPALPDIPHAFDTVYTYNSSTEEVSHKVYSESPGVTLLRTVATTWASNGTPATSIVTLEDNSTKAETDTLIDSNGLLDSVTEYDWGTGVHGSASPIRTTSYSYQTGSQYTTQNLIDLVTSKVIKDGNGTTQYRQDTSYDGTALTCPAGALQHDANHTCASNSRGNPTSVTTYLAPAAPSNGIAKSFTYDWFGNLLTAQVNCCTSKTFTYSATTQYSQPDSVVSGTSPSQLTTSYTYNLQQGVVLSSKDQNNLVTTYAYDFLRRVSSAVQTNSGTTGASVSYFYSDSAPFGATTKTTIDSSKTIQQITTIDGLGRTTSTKTEDGGSNVYSIVDTQYDLLGRAYKTSNPYTTGEVWTTTNFDVVGRPTSIVLPDNSQTVYSYSKNTITVTDPASKKRMTYYDAAGRLSMVYEPDASNGLTVQTAYAYNVLDELTGVAAPQTSPLQTRTYNYDALGRLLSSVTPEGGTTCFGSKTGSTCNTDGYDSFDNLLKRTDARGVLTSYAYDGLNRPTNVSYSVVTGVPATPTVSLTYGMSGCATTHGAGCIGQLITMADGSGSENYTYNSLEQMTQLQKIISGGTLTTSYTYNQVNELTQITYPSGRVVQQNLDALGRLCSVGASGSTCSSGTTYATGFAYNAAQQVTGFNYGNGVAASFGYSANRLQLTSISYSKSGTTQFGVTYSYGTAPNNNGQISSITDTVDNGRSVTYTYDPLARLSTAVTVGSTNYPKWGLSWAYDQFGNRTDQNQTNGTTPTNHVLVSTATNRITTGGYAYDANGNMTNDGANTIVYDAENRAVSAGSGAYTYDGNGLRVQKVSGGTTTVYVYSGSKVIAEYNGAEGVQKEYIYSGGKLLAAVGANDLSNGGFEQGLTGWSPWACAQLETNSANAHSGSNYVQLTSTNGALCAIIGPTMAVKPGDQITFGGWANLQSGNGYVGWNMSVFDINNNPIASPEALPNATSSGWTYQTGTYTVPSNGASVYVYAQIYAPTVTTVAFVDDGFISAGTKYYHQDHLSNRLVTDANGNVLEQMGHFPFGESWYNATSDKLTFTTYERDAESGNDYAQARYYVNRLGRFSSLDLYSGTTADPQSLNHYTYVRNNPIGLVDPTGLMEEEACDEDDDSCGGGGGGEGFCLGCDVGWTPPADDDPSADDTPTPVDCIPDGNGGCANKIKVTGSGPSNPLSPLTNPYYGDPSIGPSGLDLTGGGFPQGPRPIGIGGNGTPLSDTAKNCSKVANNQVNNELTTFAGYAGIRIVGRMAIGAGIGAIKALSKGAQAGSVPIIAASATVGAITGAVLSVYSDSRTIQKIQNSYMDKFMKCLGSSTPQPPMQVTQ
jgi:RHS repeat-associated protein